MKTPTDLVLGSTRGIARVVCERLARHGASFVSRERDPKASTRLAATASS